MQYLRTFVEAIAVKACGFEEYSYEIFQKHARVCISSQANLKFLAKFHKYLQRTNSHYLCSEENSERLMLTYYVYLLRIKSLLKDVYSFEVLNNIDKFPLKTDPSLQEYYRKISERIKKPISSREKSNFEDRYYIRKLKPFFVDHEIYYEVTLTVANDKVSKFDRVIVFTNLNILPNYAVKLSITKDFIQIFGRRMPIQIIDEWEISFRPCEIANFARIFGEDLKNKSNNKEISIVESILKKTT